MPPFFWNVRWGWRSLRATPAVAVAATLVIALGTGANTAVLTVAYGVLQRPLPFADPSHLVVITLHARNGREIGVTLPDFEDWQRRVRTFAAVGAYSVVDLTVRGMGEPRLAKTALVTPSFFRVLDVAPPEGRVPSASDPDEWLVLGARLSTLPGVSHDRPAGQIGRVVTVGERSLHVSAVMPPAFGVPAEDVDAWVPAGSFSRLRLASGKEVPRVFRVLARLRPGVTVEQARSDAQRAFSEMSAAGRGLGTVQARSLEDVLFGKVRPALNALVAAALLVLFVACGNVATLLVSRAMARSRDLAVRVWLGASRWQLARAALAESFLIGAAGCALGVAVAIGCVRVFIRTAAGVVPRLDAIALDLPMLVGTLVATLGVTALCGIGPAIHAARFGVGTGLEGARATASRGARLTRRVLIVGQIAMSVVLLTGAGLVARTAAGLLADGAGADPDRVLVAKLVLSDAPRFDVATRLPMLGEMLRAVRALPGVEHAAIGTNIPPRGSQITFSVGVESNGRMVDHRVHLASVSSDFFSTLRIPVVEGRAIGQPDEQRDGPVIVLSESAARLLSPDRSLVGRELPWPLPAGAGGGKRPLVAGVVPDVKYLGLDAPPSEAIYTRWTDLPAGMGYLLVRTSGNPLALAPSVRRALRAAAPSLAVDDIRTLRSEYAASVADRRLRVVPAAGFAVLAVAVSLVGLGGLLTRSVSERRRELAIRTVLGATPRGAVRTILREGVLLTAAGVAIGLGAATAAARSMQSLLYGVGPLDPLTFTGVAVFVSVAAVTTAFLSVRRAARLEPLELLQSE